MKVLTISLVFLVLINTLTAFSIKEMPCVVKSKNMMDQVQEMFKQSTDINQVIDDLADLAMELPDLLDTCGDKKGAEEYRYELPASCVKVLDRQAKLLVKIMKLMNEDEQKNKKQIALLTATFETIYKTQAQKYCPFLKNETFQLNDLSAAASTAECMEASYRFSLLVQKLDEDLGKGNFNSSLTDFGNMILAMPNALDKCNQPQLAKLIQNNFPAECVKSLGDMAREIGVFEHHFDHFEWLSKHWKDLAKYFAELRATCPVLEKRLSH